MTEDGRLNISRCEEGCDYGYVAEPQRAMMTTMRRTSTMISETMMAGRVGSIQEMKIQTHVCHGVAYCFQHFERYT